MSQDLTQMQQPKLIKNQHRKLIRKLRSKRNRQNGTINAFKAMIISKGERRIWNGIHVAVYRFPSIKLSGNDFHHRGTTLVRIT